MADLSEEQAWERFLKTGEMTLEAVEEFGHVTSEAWRKVAALCLLNKKGSEGYSWGEEVTESLVVAIYESLMDWALQLTCRALDMKPVDAMKVVQRSRADVLQSVDYKDYLRSAWWQAKRAETLTRDGDSCRLCGSTKSLNVHHRTYKNLGDEQPLDLVTLCRDCHESFHENRKLATSSK